MRLRHWLTGIALGAVMGAFGLEFGMLALPILILGGVWAALESDRPVGVAGVLIGVGASAAGLIAVGNAQCAASNVSGNGYSASCTPPDVTPFLALAGAFVILGAALAAYLVSSACRPSV